MSRSFCGAHVLRTLAEVKKANLSAAEALKAELAASMGDDDDESSPIQAEKPTETSTAAEPVPAETQPEMEEPFPVSEDAIENGDAAVEAPRGKKRKINEAGDEEDEEDDDVEAPPTIDADQPGPKKKLSVNANGTVDYEDDVK